MIDTSTAPEIPPATPTAPVDAALTEPVESDAPMPADEHAALAQENASLKERLAKAEGKVAALTATNKILVQAKAQESEDEKMIKFKIDAGLTRSQATTVIRRQREAHLRDNRTPAPSLTLYQK
jgi:hypothetical protein